MSETTQANHLELRVSSNDALDVRHFQVVEKMSDLFRITLVARSPNADIDFEAVVGQAAELTVQRAPGVTRTWTGMCTHLQQIAVEEHGLSTYEITIAPVAWMMTQRRNYRMFQRLSELAIVLQLLQEWKITPVLKITEKYKKRKCRVQYGERDFAFMCRMLEDAGIAFYFETEDGQTKLVLNDAPQVNEPRPPLHFHDKPSLHDPEHVTAVHIGRRVRPGKYTVRDLDYRKPAFNLVSGSTGGSSNEEALERFHYAPGAFLNESAKGEATPIADDKGKYRPDEADATALTKRRLAAKRGSAKHITFKTGALDLAPGVVLTMLDHPKSELAPQQKLLVVGSSFSGEHGAEWSHACEAVTADVDYKPRLVTPKPKVMGVESATVVGPPGEAIHVDELGRVRVQFHWDRLGAKDDNSSCWVPVSHPWGGQGFGMVNIPRVGHEVIVDFLGGDPDRPVIVGRVYTSTSVPYPLPANKTQSGWKTSSTPGGGGYNELMFEDLAGSELLRMQAEKDLKKLVKHDEGVTIGHDRTKKVGNDDRLTVGNNRTRMVGNNESVTVGSNQTITVGANQTITVGANQALTVNANQTITLPHGNQTESIKGNRDFTLKGNLTETHIGNWDLTQTGARTETHTGGSEKTQTGDRGEMLKGNLSIIQLGNRSDIQVGNEGVMRAGNESHLQLGGQSQIQIGSRSDLQLGGFSSVEIGARGEAIFGTRTLTVLGPNTETVSGPQTTTTGVNTETVAGAKTLNAATISLGAGSINVEATGETVIKGSIIKLN
ncbi:MAG: type VI secretion system tip protein TssI/VgrG [Byssovorax sp.]